ncbi:MAG: DNA topoisomerase IV subunit A [Rickettsiales bacterium]
MTENIEIVEFPDALGERYLNYALSTIMSRSLPDLRDGLKPVHRRILYSMYLLKLDHKAGYKKCARVVGDVMGKFHPHGDVAIYDALVRYAQDFTVRYPLVDGQGNFGSIDGDSAAAMRYTESRLTEIAQELLNDLNKNTVEFKSNYDDQDQEPTVLPSSFPNILANGSEGIAVGMATSIPPHNLHELCDAMKHIIDNPECEVKDILKFVSGPDFPTGGELIESKASIHNSYLTGKGSFKVRATWKKEELDRGMYQIVVTEVPYQVQKSKLIEKIAELFKSKKIPLLGDIRDESTDDMRIVFEPKSRSVDPEILMESMFKLTDLESRVSLNLNVLDKNSIPKVMNIKEVLRQFLEFREEVVTKRAKFQLEKVEKRLEILEGFLIVYLNLDEVIRIIRFEDDAKAKLQETFKLTEMQVESILNMRLKSLKKLEEMEIKNEHKNLTQERTRLKALLKDKGLRWNVITEEIDRLQEKYGKKTSLGKRRTRINTNFDHSKTNISQEVFIEKEPITIICSEMGWIRAVKSHNYDTSNIKYKDGDKEGFFVKGYTTDKLIIATSHGKFFTIGCDKIPRVKGHGDSLKVIFDTDNAKLVELFIYKEGQELLLASHNGKGFIVESKEVMAQTKNGKQIMNVDKNDSMKFIRVINGENVAAIGNNRKLLVFDLADIPKMKRGRGVTLQKYKDAKLSDIKTFKSEEGLSWQLGDRTRNEMELLTWLGKRANVGKMPPTGFPKNNKFNLY